MKKRSIVFFSIFLIVAFSIRAWAVKEFAIEFPSGTPIEVYTPNNPPSGIDVNWEDIQNFPAACPSGDFISKLGATPTCDTPAGGGDMNQSTYDKDGNDFVDWAEGINADGINWTDYENIPAAGINWTDIYVPDNSINWAIQVPKNETDPVWTAEKSGYQTALSEGTDYLNKTHLDAAYEPLGVAAADITDISANGASLITAANYAAMRGLLDLEAGTDFYSIAAADLAFEPLGVAAADITDISANGASLITAANYAAMRGLLDLEAGTDFYSKSAIDTDFAFASFPTTPSAAPDADYEVANKKYVDDNIGGGGATTALDNLASVAINTSLTSDTADTDDLGSTTKEWANLYIGDAGKIYLGLGQDLSIYRSAANEMTLTASSGVKATSLNLSGLTASEIVITDASKNLASAAVATYPSLTELSYVKGLSSAVQTQINAKAPAANPTFTGTVDMSGATVKLPTHKVAGFQISNGDDAIDASATDPVACQRISETATITAWYLACDQSGSIIIDVWKNTWDDTPETNTDSIAGTEKPTLSGDVSASDTSLTSMTTSWSAGDNVCIEIESSATVTKCDLQFVGNN